MSNNYIRHPIVAGKFYPDRKEDLSFQIKNYLEQTDILKLNKRIRSLILPHAGYSFSGPAAAAGYKQIQGEKRRNVFLLGNSHSSFFEGIAISEASSWHTPLGEVVVAKEKAEELIGSDKNIFFNEEPHIKEHCLEVQLPFLQEVLKGGFRIIPLLFGNDSKEDYKLLGQALLEVSGKEDLIIASSDMSHYPPYEEANRIDKKTLSIISQGDIEELENHIREVEEQTVPGEETLLCGEDAVKTCMYLFKKADWEGCEILKYNNSGDSELVSKESVVGYGTLAFYHGKRFEEEEKKELDKRIDQEIEEKLGLEEREFLLKVARETVESYAKEGRIPNFNVDNKKLLEPRGAFVTLKKRGELRGCIGQIVQSKNPLWKVVQNMALAAAFKDSRFLPVKEEELSQLDYEISILSLPSLIFDWKEIELGKHGVIIKKGEVSGVFLPQVAEETGWNKEEFLSQLCWHKAGLDPDSYKKDPDLEIYVFTVENFGS